jgi:hypothetical protein
MKQERTSVNVIGVRSASGTPWAVRSSGSRSPEPKSVIRTQVSPPNQFHPADPGRPNPGHTGHRGETGIGGTATHTQPGMNLETDCKRADGSGRRFADDRPCSRLRRPSPIGEREACNAPRRRLRPLLLPRSHANNDTTGLRSRRERTSIAGPLAHHAKGTGHGSRSTKWSRQLRMNLRFTHYSHARRTCQADPPQKMHSPACSLRIDANPIATELCLAKQDSIRDTGRVPKRVKWQVAPLPDAKVNASFQRGPFRPRPKALRPGSR